MNNFKNEACVGSGIAITVGSVPGALRSPGPGVGPAGVNSTLPRPGFHNSLFKDSREYLIKESFEWLWVSHARGPQTSLGLSPKWPFLNQIFYHDILGWRTLQPKLCIYKAECMQECPWGYSGAKGLWRLLLLRSFVHMTLHYWNQNKTPQTIKEESTHCTTLTLIYWGKKPQIRTTPKFRNDTWDGL